MRRDPCEKKKSKCFTETDHALHRIVDHKLPKRSTWPLAAV